MSPTAAVLILISTLTHAGWNMVSKREHPSTAFFFLGNIAGLMVMSPLVIIHYRILPAIPAPVWMLLTLSGACMALYYTSLAAAYRAGDMSVVYPLARSSPAIIVTVTAFILGRGHEIGRPAILGIVLIVGGCFVLSMKDFSDLKLSNYLSRHCLFALTAAVATTGYTIADDEALRHLREVGVDGMSSLEWSIVYIVLQGVFCTVWMMPGVALMRKERARISKVMHSSLHRAALMGIGIYLAYTLVLTSMAYVVNVSYVAAFRQLSIPLGAVLGMMVLDEPRHLPKCIGVATIFLGLILVAVG